MTDLQLLDYYCIIEGEGMEYCKNAYPVRHVGLVCDYDDYSCKKCPFRKFDRDKLEADIKKELLE
jgi:hypothetical protein